ncbi:hypothetical protein JQS43_24470 [Natronosporangium hydrolyticum]|uniref:Uncharacterized protein n=1 Tax=Natronosporangium hydrolyticum TaxID=2811111 RepID=A0A895YL49_9ACTN|nr:hypothetical protein [Natronosporangium hydrolyticum]QSB14588.1 hypothetical protein JQS43_24470 [Natronosporangium hydrolyticum]
MTSRGDLRRRLAVLRDQWRTATAAGDHARAAQIEATARQIQAGLDQPEPARRAELVTVHGWWLVSATPMHRGCDDCRRAPGGPDHP